MFQRQLCSKHQLKLSGPTVKLLSVEPGDDPTALPKVYIVDEHSNELYDPSVIMEETIQPPRQDDNNNDIVTTTLKQAQATPMYELSGNKHHSVVDISTSTATAATDTATHYKHWHNYTIESPGHSQGSRLEGLLAAKTGYVLAVATTDNNNNNKDGSISVGASKPLLDSRLYNNTNELKLNINDTKFLELNYPKNFLTTTTLENNKITPTATAIVPAKLPKLNNNNEKKNVSSPITPKIPNTAKSVFTSAGVSSSSSKGGADKKLYCLTCDKDVADRSCGHTTTIIVQEKV